MARGFVYLAAVIDWLSRRVLAWRLSITMEAALCVEALEEALARYGRPEIFNTDQGSQFTSLAFTDVLTKAKVAISMDGRAPGGTMSSSNGSGGRSNTRRSISGPTTRSAKPHLDRPLPGLLQWTEAPFCPRPADPGPSLLHPAAACRGSLNPTGRHLSPPARSFKQTEPPLSRHGITAWPDRFNKHVATSFRTS